MANRMKDAKVEKMSSKDIASQRAVFSRLPPIVNGDATLVRRGRFLDLAIGWGNDAELWVVRVRDGQGRI